MPVQDHYVLAKFGIDEIYIHEGFTHVLLEKLHQRAAFSLDGENHVIQKFASHDMVLIFQKQAPSQSLIYRFLKSFDQLIDIEDFVKFNTILNEEELYSTIKSKTFILITKKILLKEND